MFETDCFSQPWSAMVNGWGVADQSVRAWIRQCGNVMVCDGIWWSYDKNLAAYFLDTMKIVTSANVSVKSQPIQQIYKYQQFSHQIQQDEPHTWAKDINSSSAELDFECIVATKGFLNLIQQSSNRKTLCSIWVWRHHRPVYCMVDKAIQSQ